MYYLGIDMGSTSTKVIVLNENKEIHYKKVVPTGWNCLDTANGILEELKNNGIERDNFKCVATGYGRISVPYMDKTITEISCHGKGACFLFNEKNFTVIDIGGQDTKVIEIENGAVKNFNMNDKCSAGTGKFLEILCPGAWGYRMTGSTQGHQRHPDRRHIPSGLVRARLKRETDKEIEFSLSVEKHNLESERTP